ncbi:MAG TPA: hypothetical protein VGD91_27750 [Trebonia sp.]
MSGTGDNYGVQFGDSATVSGGAIGGAGSRIWVNQSPGPPELDELRNALSSLIDQLRGSPAEVDDPAALAEVAVSAREEADKEKPNKHILSGLLHALMAGVQNSAALADAVLAIQHAVSSLL